MWSSLLNIRSMFWKRSNVAYRATQCINTLFMWKKTLLQSCILLFISRYYYYFTIKLLHIRLNIGSILTNALIENHFHCIFESSTNIVIETLFLHKIKSEYLPFYNKKDADFRASYALKCSKHTPVQGRGILFRVHREDA